MVNTATDLTPRRRAAATALATRRQRRRARNEKAALDQLLFRTLVESSWYAVEVFDAEGQILYTGSATLRILGYLPEETVGKSTFDFIHPDSLPAAEAVWGRMLQSPGVAVPGLLRMCHKNGTLRQIEGQLLNLLHDPVVRGVVASYRDITEATEANRQVLELSRRKQMILNAAAEGIFGLDAAGIATFVNPSAARLLGRDDEQLVGRSLHEIIHTAADSENPLADCQVCSSVLDPLIRSSQSISFVRRDGSEFPVEATASTIMTDSGGRDGVVVTFRDITERNAIERMKNEFVSTVSHELRTPLTSIRGSLGLLAGGLMGSVGERFQRMLNIAVSNTDRLVRLINDILEIEKMQSGTMEMCPRVVDMHQLMIDAGEVMQAMADRGGVLLRIEPVKQDVYVDPDRIMQVLTNLLSNAIKFTPNGGTVTLDTTIDSSWFTFHVTDTGRGIPADKLELIFERFQQVDASDSRAKGGTGLGLPICRGIAQLHGGWIWAESPEGKGSVFHFRVPVNAGP